MNLFNFYRRFPDESSCRKHLKKVRDQQGVICKKCGSTEHYWLAPKEQYQCKQCRFRTTLLSGTIMESSKLPLQYWFMAIHLMTSTKKSFSALEMQRQLGHKRYEPIWAMMHKIRLAMGKRDDNYTLEGQVEMDEGFFKVAEFKAEKEDDDKDDNPPRKRGRGSSGQKKVVVMASVKPSKTKGKGRPKTSLKYVKMVVVDDLSSETLESTAKDAIDPSSEITTDGFRSYNNFKNILKKHSQWVMPPALVNEYLPWVHTVISNAKRLFLGIYHSVTTDFIQNYLNEFCYKLNRRMMGKNLFERSMIAAVANPWY